MKDRDQNQPSMAVVPPAKFYGVYLIAGEIFSSGMPGQVTWQAGTELPAEVHSAFAPIMGRPANRIQIWACGQALPRRFKVLRIEVVPGPGAPPGSRSGLRLEFDAGCSRGRLKFGIFRLARILLWGHPLTDGELFLRPALSLGALLFEPLHFLLSFLKCNGHRALLELDVVRSAGNQRADG